MFLLKSGNVCVSSIILLPNKLAPFLDSNLRLNGYSPSVGSLLVKITIISWDLS